VSLRSTEAIGEKVGSGNPIGVLVWVDQTGYSMKFPKKDNNRGTRSVNGARGRNPAKRVGERPEKKEKRGEESDNIGLGSLPRLRNSETTTKE